MSTAADGDDCPAETILVEFAEGELALQAAAALEAHLDNCSTCRRALAEIARAVVPNDRSIASTLDEEADLTALRRSAGLPPILLAAGEVVADRYRVERLLAWGGNGVVYVAVHLETEERVALKLLFVPIGSGSKKMMEGFRLEARAFARIESEHIVRVLDAGIDERRKLRFIAMELLVGETLGDKVRKGGVLAPAALVTVLGQVASALDAAHGLTDDDGKPMPIVHRDLKPENIFLAVDPGGSVRAKVLDFGIAKVASANATESGAVRGTPQYMAPEQLDGAPVSAETDIAALGLIAFFCLTGRSYWKAAGTPSPLATLVREIVAGTTALASERARELGVIDLDLSPRFDAWFARCTAYSPAARFSSAGDAVSAFAAAFDAATAVSTSHLGVRATVTSRATRQVGLLMAEGPTFAALTSALRRAGRAALWLDPHISPLRRQQSLEAIVIDAELSEPNPLPLARDFARAQPDAVLCAVSTRPFGSAWTVLSLHALVLLPEQLPLLVAIVSGDAAGKARPHVSPEFAHRALGEIPELLARLEGSLGEHDRTSAIQQCERLERVAHLVALGEMGSLARTLRVLLEEQAVDAPSGFIGELTRSFHESFPALLAAQKPS